MRSWCPWDVGASTTKAFTACQYLHIEGHEADSFKLHLIMIRSILAPVKRHMVNTKDGPAPNPTSTTSAHIKDGQGEAAAMVCRGVGGAVGGGEC